MSRRAALSIALSAGMLLTVVASAAPALASDEVGLSPDGVVWYDALQRPLFDPTFRWVPGDAEIASFYVRNQGPAAARMTMEMRDADGASVLGSHDFEIAARVAGGEWRALDDGVSPDRMTEQALGRHDQVRMDVRVRFAWAGRNDAMLRRLPLDFEVRLVQAGSSEGNPGDLPGTGSAVSRWLLLLAGALVGAGAGLVAGVRRHG